MWPCSPAFAYQCTARATSSLTPTPSSYASPSSNCASSRPRLRTTARRRRPRARRPPSRRPRHRPRDRPRRDPRRAQASRDQGAPCAARAAHLRLRGGQRGVHVVVVAHARGVHPTVRAAGRGGDFLSACSGSTRSATVYSAWARPHVPPCARRSLVPPAPPARSPPRRCRNAGARRGHQPRVVQRTKCPAAASITRVDAVPNKIGGYRAVKWTQEDHERTVRRNLRGARRVQASRSAAFGKSKDNFYLVRDK